MAMCGYKAFYKGKEIELYAETLYGAQLKAAEQFGVPAKKSYQVHVVLCEVDGSQVVHVAA